MNIRGGFGLQTGTVPWLKDRDLADRLLLWEDKYTEE